MLAEPGKGSEDVSQAWFCGGWGGGEDEAVGRGEFVHEECRGCWIVVFAYIVCALIICITYKVLLTNNICMLS